MAEKKNYHEEKTGMILVVSYAVLLVVNSLVIWLANLIFPYFVVLGTGNIPYFWAIIHSMGILALINTFAIPIVRLYEKQKRKMLTTKDWMILYFLINLAGVWLIARMADQFGLGIRSWMVAVVLAVVLDFVQGMAMMWLEKYRSRID